MLLQSYKCCYNFVLRNATKFTETFERHGSLETCLKWAFLLKHCASLTPSFKGRILIPLPRGKQGPLGACFLLLRRSKDSQNPYCKATRFSGTSSKSMILVTGEVLIPLPIRAETAEIQLFLLFFVPKLPKIA